MEPIVLKENCPLTLVLELVKFSSALLLGEKYPKLNNNRTWSCIKVKLSSGQPLSQVSQDTTNCLMYWGVHGIELEIHFKD